MKLNLTLKLKWVLKNKFEEEEVDMKKELYFEQGEKELSQEKWEAQGTPIMWYKMYEKDGIIIYADRAFGKIKLVTPKGESIDTEMVIVEDVIAFGLYYEGFVEVYVPYKKCNNEFKIGGRYER